VSKTLVAALSRDQLRGIAAAALEVWLGVVERGSPVTVGFDVLDRAVRATGIAATVTTPFIGGGIAYAPGERFDVGDVPIGNLRALVINGSIRFGEAA
jgi:hypothetical protein